ncbi:SRPBCC family protein [Nocardia otitidiscaviarum]|uniref:SRPBCC family protein n=1 Tax=Nocardia otitidiscaviarum TaxID=1823 RepID=UPI00189608EE|nr:SRPBCC family protein [Nocardia otitidiscaviarum]MBF6240564.1 SRPBCC family protein [Nocardia otitidiscaviarum]
METITVERIVAAPPHAVFDWMSNAHNYTRVGFVLHEHLARPGADAPYGVGAVRVLGWAVGWFWERITAYDPPHSFEFHVYRAIPPARHEGGSVTFTAVPGGTRVVWSTQVELRFPLLGAFLTRLIARPILTYVFKRVLDEANAELRTVPSDRGTAAGR